MELQVRAGKGAYWKPIEDLFLKVNGEEIKLTDMVLYIRQLEADIHDLQHRLEIFNDNENRVDMLMVQSIDLLSKKIARLEYEVKEIKGEEE